MADGRSLFSHPRYLASAALAVLAIAGCGDANDATVIGVAMLDNKPLPSGVVSFKPQATGPSAYGQISADGKYQLWTGREEGLPSGQYLASVISTEASGSTGKNGGPPPLGKAIAPLWYGDPTTSGLTIEVKPGDNEINLPLSSTPPPGWKPPPPRRR